MIAGPQRKSRILGPKERELTAYHEGGHALLGKLLPQANPPHKVTILPRGMALGYVLLLPAGGEVHADAGRDPGEHHGDAGRPGGGGGHVRGDHHRGGQRLRAGDRAGAEDGDRVRDVRQARAARRSGRSTGRCSWAGTLVESRNYSDEIAYEIDKEVRRIIDECYSRARQVLTEHKVLLERIANAAAGAGVARRATSSTR